MKSLLSRKVLQASETNPERKEMAEATEVVVAQVAVDTRAGGVVAIEVPDHRAIRIDPRAIQETKWKSLDQDHYATGVRKEDIDRRTASDIKQQKRETKKRKIDKQRRKRLTM
jgi:hypothetical protein